MNENIDLNMTKEKYLGLDYIKRKELWEFLIGNPKLRLFGKVHKRVSSFTAVGNVQSILKDNKLAYVINPLNNGKSIDRVIGVKPISDEMEEKNIDEGDYVTFSVEVISGFFQDGHDPIVIKKGTISKMEDADLPAEVLSQFEAKQSNIFNDFIVNKDGVLEYVSPSIKDLLEKLTEEITDLNKRKEVLTENNNALEQRLKERKLQQDDELENIKQQKIAEINREVKKLEATKLKLENYRLFQPNSQVEDKLLEKEEVFKIEDLLQVLKYIQYYLITDQDSPLYYDFHTILQFYMGLRTDQLVVLAGSPGTGKSSLVGAFAEAINANYRMVPVQPNWVDKSDLLGFYNPIEKAYISTPFLDTILEARKEKNKNKLFIICLDEMNLAHVEYYFAEFLSKLQTDREIDLYSPNIKKNIENEIKERYNYFEQSIQDLSINEFLQQNEKVEIENYFKLKKQFDFLQQYSPILEIPENIRFVGTVNKDETTKDLSPKVIDRSFFIWINRYKMDDVVELTQNLGNIQTKRSSLPMKLNDFVVRKGDVNDRLQEYIDSLTKELEPFSIHLTNRFQRTVQQLVGIEALKLTDIDIKDIILSSLVLPKFSVDNYEADLDQLLSILELKISDEVKHSKELLKAMTVREDNESRGQLEMITYWR